MKKTILRSILIILLGLTFFTIFQFSNQNGDKSSGLSKKVARKIVDIYPYTKNLSEETKNKIVKESQPLIRKGAHFSIYMVVGILIMTFMSTYEMRLIKKFLISLGVGGIYAISDEVHQSFIPGRSPSPIDVGIDTAGVIFGIIIALIIISVFKSLLEKNNINFNRNRRK